MVPAVICAEFGGSQRLYIRFLHHLSSDGQTLTYVRIPDEKSLFQDEKTGSIWNLSGIAVDDPLQGAQLVPLPPHDTFWFAWAAFVPADTLMEE
jgi:hypothetical protein